MAVYQRRIQEYKIHLDPQSEELIALQSCFLNISIANPRAESTNSLVDSAMNLRHILNGALVNGENSQQTTASEMGSPQPVHAHTGNYGMQSATRTPPTSSPAATMENSYPHLLGNSSLLESLTIPHDSVEQQTPAPLLGKAPYQSTDTKLDSKAFSDPTDRDLDKLAEKVVTRRKDDLLYISIPLHLKDLNWTKEKLLDNHPEYQVELVRKHLLKDIRRGEFAEE